MGYFSGFKMLAITAMALLLATSAGAAPCERGQRSFTMNVGIGLNHDYPSPTKSRLRYDVAHLRWGEFKSPRNEKAFELGIGTLVKGSDHSIISAVASRRHDFLVRDKLSMGYELGFGFVYLEDKVPELGTHLNFTEQAGLVIQRHLGHDTALTFQYKLSHISNAGIKPPNVGLNTSILTIGITRFK